jgi:hypothetical protein
MGIIKPLPDLLISQIAAGEVVERPASVLKELLENSLDAGATKIDVQLEEGGVRLIRVADDGGGMPRRPAAGAGAPCHEQDRQPRRPRTRRQLGLSRRGAGIDRRVARVTITSRARRSPRLHACAARAARSNPPALGTGTVIEVADLYFNTPARRKFLKSEATEYAPLRRGAAPHGAGAYRGRLQLQPQRQPETPSRRRRLFDAARAKSSATNSSPRRARSMPMRRAACASPGSPRCRPIRAPGATNSTSSSMAASCATSC